MGQKPGVGGAVILYDAIDVELVQLGAVVVVGTGHGDGVARFYYVTLWVWARCQGWRRR